MSSESGRPPRPRAGVLIGGGSVVTRDVAAGVVAFGNPAVTRRGVADVPAMELRGTADNAPASRYRRSGAPATKGTRP